MGRRSDFLTNGGAPGVPGRPEIIQVVSRAFTILRCFENATVRLGNRQIADRCGLPPATVSRLAKTLTFIGELAYVSSEQKYCLVARPVEGKLQSHDLMEARREALTDKNVNVGSS